MRTAEVDKLALQHPLISVTHNHECVPQGGKRARALSQISLPRTQSAVTAFAAGRGELLWRPCAPPSAGQPVLGPVHSALRPRRVQGNVLKVAASASTHQHRIEYSELCDSRSRQNLLLYLSADWTLLVMASPRLRRAGRH